MLDYDEAMIGLLTMRVLRGEFPVFIPAQATLGAVEPCTPVAGGASESDGCDEHYGQTGVAYSRPAVVPAAGGSAGLDRRRPTRHGDDAG